MQGFLPTAGEASLFVEISPGIEMNRVTDIAVKATDVRPGMQIVERLYGMPELHSPSPARVHRCGEEILAALESFRCGRFGTLSGCPALSSTVQYFPARPSASFPARATS